MKTMGVTDLVIIGSPADHDPDQIRTTSLHAWDVYQSCRYHDCLEEGLRGTTLAAGITRRVGHRRKRVHGLPEDLAETVVGTTGPVAAVFGTERSGLTDAELDLCDLAVRIPSSPAFPSLNLSHAVQVITYTLYRATTKELPREVVDRERLQQVVGTLISTLKEMDYFKLTDGSYTERLFREVLARAGLHSVEADRIEKLFRNLPYFRADGQ
jgi:tRNA/rRNA methyltransferase